MRLRESAIVTILLLGLTGCAGVQPRLGWMQPSTAGAEDSEGRPLSRLAFWRHHSADDRDASADETILASNDEGNSRPRLLRRLPVVSRFFKDDRTEESYELGSPATRYARGLLSPPSNAVATTAPAPSATARPIQTTAANVPAAVRPEAPTGRELAVNLAGNRPDVDAATIPVRNPAAFPPPLQNTPPSSNTPTPPTAPATLPNLGPDNVPPPTAVPGPAPSIESPDLVPATPVAPASPASPSRGPSTPPSSTPEPQPAAKPAASETANASPTVTSTPGPAWPVESPSIESSYVGSAQSSGQSVVMATPQGGYISGGCESPCGAKCKVHKLCPLKKHKQMVSSCEATVPCKKECFLKKWLHHKSGCKLKGCKGCKSCAYCGEAPAMVSAQGPMVSSQW